MLTKKLLLLAAGGHGRVVLDAVLAQGLKVAGILDPALPIGSHVFDVPVLGADDWLHSRDTSEFILINGAGSTPRSNLRRQLFEQWQARGLEFFSVCHPCAVIGREVVLRQGSQIMAGAVVQTGAVIGNNSVINTGARIDHDCTVADHVFIGPGVVVCGGVQLGEGTFLGASSVLLPGLHLGSNVVVGAGAVVTQDVPDGALVVGHPASPRPARPTRAE